MREVNKSRYVKFKISSEIQKSFIIITNNQSYTCKLLYTSTDL